MGDMGPQAGVFAGHAAIIAAAAMLVWRFVPMARVMERATGKDARDQILSVLPLTISLFAIVAVAEALYYGAARLVLAEGWNLWQSYPAVWFLRASVAATIVLHMPAYWRWRGCDSAEIRRRTLRDGSIILSVWFIVLLLLW